MTSEYDWLVNNDPIIARELAAVHGGVPVPGSGFRVPGSGFRVPGYGSRLTDHELLQVRVGFGLESCDILGAKE
jgi:hypothetical protein